MALLPSPSFRELLRQYREAAGLTQEELAERADLSERAISDLERGVRQRPQAYTLQALADALELVDAERAHFVAVAKGRATLNGSRPTATTAPERGSSGPPFVGRGHELGLVQRHLDGDAPPVLMLAGEPGIGKSRLLGEAVQRARSAGWAVLVAGCQRWGSEEPYAPLRAAVQEQIRTLSPADRRAALAGCSWLVHLLPELAGGSIEPLPAWTVPPDQIRRLMFEATARLLRHVAGPRGTLLVLDDLQWAGKDALDLLAALVQAPEAAVRVVGAYRDTEAPTDGPLATLLYDLARAGRVQHCALAPLSPGDAQELLGHLLPGTMAANDAIRERVVQRTGGVPFFVVSCAQALRLDQTAQRDGAAVPWDVAQSVRQRVAALPATTRTVLAAAAVVGRAVRADVLVEVTRGSEDEVLDALDAAYAVRLLDEDAHGYRFAHDLVREVVEADVSQGRRAVWHRRIAEALERAEEPAQPDLLAYHYSRSDDRAKAALYLERAGDSAQAEYANAAAEGYYQELVQCLKSLGRVPDAARAREKLAAVLTTTARYDAALVVLEQAAETYRMSEDLESLGRVTAEIGRVHASKGTPGEGVNRLQPLLERLEAAGLSHGLAALYGALAQLFFISGRYREQLAAAERAAVLARELGDARILTDAEHMRGNALGFMGHLGDALRAWEAVLPLAEAANDLYTLSTVNNGVAEIHLIRGEWNQIQIHIERALEAAQRRGDPDRVAFLTGQQGLYAFFRGDWSQARAKLEEALVMYENIDEFSQTGRLPINAAFALINLGYLSLAEGARDAASQYLEQAVMISEPSGNMEALRWAHRALAERDLRDGYPVAARNRLIPLLDRPSLEEHDVTSLLPLLAWAHLELGDVEQADAVVTQAIVRMHAKGDRLNLVDALRVQALFVAQQGRWEAACQALEEGLSFAQDMPYPYAEAKLLHVYGMLQAQQGRREAARGRLERALAIFQQLGAHEDVERVAQAIADNQRL